MQSAAANSHPLYLVFKTQRCSLNLTYLNLSSHFCHYYVQAVHFLVSKVPDVGLHNYVLDVGLRNCALDEGLHNYALDETVSLRRYVKDVLRYVDVLPDE